MARSAQPNIAEIPKAIRELVNERDGEQCVYCLSQEGPFHLDHVVPRARGGTNEASNLVVACASCNRRKRDRTPEEMGWEFGRVMPPPRLERVAPDPSWASWADRLEAFRLKFIERKVAKLNAEIAADTHERRLIMNRCIRRMRRAQGKR